MKKKYLLMGFSVLIISFTFYSFDHLGKTNITSEQGKKIIQETVDVKPKGTIKAELSVYPFQEAVKEADSIVEVQIIKKLEEINEPSPKTLFEATAIENYKGENNEKMIQILQEGNSEWVYEDNNLFQANDKYILFLKKYEGNEYDSDKTYWILGAQTNTYSVLNNNEIMKNAYYDEELSDIEKTKEIENSNRIIDTKMNNLRNVSIDEKDLKEADIQVFNKDTFVNELNNTVKLIEK